MPTRLAYEKVKELASTEAARLTLTNTKKITNDSPRWSWDLVRLLQSQMGQEQRWIMAPKGTSASFGYLLLTSKARTPTLLLRGLRGRDSTVARWLGLYSPRADGLCTKDERESRGDSKCLIYQNT